MILVKVKEMNLSEMNYHLKNCKLIRILVKPYKDWSRKKGLREYSKTEDSRLLQGLKNVHKGKRCFIIGNGPSLKVEDLEKFVGEYTFGTNRIYNIYTQTDWRPQYYMAVDPDFICTNAENIQNSGAEKIFISNICKIKNKKKNVIYIYEYSKFAINKWNDCNAIISEDISKFFSIGYTVTFSAIQLAIYMGFTEIYLLGVDFNYSVIRNSKGDIVTDSAVKDYFDGKKYNSTVLNYSSCLNSYCVAKEYCEKHGIRIYNATRGGKLEVFERVELEQIL